MFDEYSDVKMESRMQYEGLHSQNCGHWDIAVFFSSTVI